MSNPTPLTAEEIEALEIRHLQTVLDPSAANATSGTARDNALLYLRYHATIDSLAEQLQQRGERIKQLEGFLHTLDAEDILDPYTLLLDDDPKWSEVGAAIIALRDEPILPVALIASETPGGEEE